MAEAYSTVAYWNNRYATDSDPFEWYIGYAVLKPLLHKRFGKKPDRLLHLGCGTSSLGEDMLRDDFKAVVNLDFSEILINKLRSHAKIPKGLAYALGDVTELSDMEDRSFDAIVDKGTLDCICVIHEWEFCVIIVPSAIVPEHCKKAPTSSTSLMMRECSRILKPGGVLVCVSHGSPPTRMSIFAQEQLGWEVSVESVPRPDFPDIINLAFDTTATRERPYYVYVCRKRENAS